MLGGAPEAHEVLSKTPRIEFPFIVKISCPRHFRSSLATILLQQAVSGPRDKLYGMRGYFDIARLGGYYSPARGQRNQKEKVILCFQGYFLISAGQFCTRVKGWFSSFTSPVLMRNFLPSAVTV